MKHELLLKEMRIQQLLVEGMKEVCPDVRISCEHVLMRRWSKDTEAVFDAAGRLQPWEAK